MGAVMSDVHFAVRNDDGTYGTPVRLDGPLEISACGSEDVGWSDDDVRKAFEPRTFTGTLQVRDAQVMSDVIGGLSKPDTSKCALVFDQSWREWSYRHRCVWQYRCEHKGNRANRKVRGHWERGRVRTVMPDVVVTGIGHTISAGAEPAPVTVSFEAGSAFMRDISGSVGNGGEGMVE